PPEEVAARDALRQWLLLRTDRKDDLVRGRELLSDLKARVPTSDDEHRPLRHVTRLAVTRAMGLPDLRGEVLGKLGHERRLEGAGRDHNLVGNDRPAVDLEDEVIALPRNLPYLAVQLDRELERLCVAL